MKKFFKKLEEILLYWGEITYEHRKRTGRPFWY